RVDQLPCSKDVYLMGPNRAYVVEGQDQVEQQKDVWRHLRTVNVSACGLSCGRHSTPMYCGPCRKAAMRVCPTGSSRRWSLARQRGACTRPAARAPPAATRPRRREV